MLDPVILEKILLMQNHVVDLPTSDALFSLVCSELANVPGVASAHHSPFKDSTPNDTSINYTLNRNNNDFGTLTIRLSDKNQFAPYHEYIHNFMAIIEVILQEQYVSKTHRESEEHLQAQLVQSQKLDAIGNLAGGIAHDFNNMLGGIMGGVQLLDKNIPKNEKTSKYIKLIMDSAQRAADLTSKLLSFSHKSKSLTEPVAMNTILSDAVSLLETTIDKRITLTTTLTDESSIVLGETSQLHNMFLNLGINASHAMPDGGTLSFASKVITLNDSDCSASSFDLSPGAYIEIGVSDTGHGMSSDVITHIFDPFFTTKEQGNGTGLGLSVVYRSVQQHNGAITVTSEPEHGTTFTIQIPVTTAPPLPDVKQQSNTLGSGTILLIDDEPVMLDVGKAILEDCGYTVLTASNGHTGVDVYKQHSKEIKLVVLDMVMPVMGGKDCCKLLKVIEPTLPIILVSGYTNPQDLDDLSKLGCNVFIEKPFSSMELSQAVAKLTLS
ncbi:MAG: response regulator [Fibrobacterales bacterium]